MKHIILKQSSCVKFLFFLLLILDSFVPNRDWSRSDSSKTDSSTDKVDKFSSTFLTKNRFPNSFNFLSRSRRKFSADSSKLLLQPKILLSSKIQLPDFHFRRKTSTKTKSPIVSMFRKSFPKIRWRRLLSKDSGSSPRKETPVHCCRTFFVSIRLADPPIH